VIKLTNLEKDLLSLPLEELGEIAFEKKRKVSQDFVYFTHNYHINYSNECLALCPMCAFGKPLGEGYTLSLKEVEDKLKKLKEKKKNILEIHIVGSLNPNLPYKYYISLIELAKKYFPESTVKAFTATEIAYLSKKENKSIEDILKDMKVAGLDVLPGGGAEILKDDLRKILCPNKIDSFTYLKVHKIAHKLKIKTNITMLFGHIESWEDRIYHLKLINEVYKETEGFLVFIPLLFHPKNTKFEGKVKKVFPAEIYRLIAISRILLDIPHIKSYWVMLTPKVAQTALLFGADDLDGCVYEEKITKYAKRSSPDYLNEENLKKLIWDVDLTPVLRDGKFNIKKVYEKREYAYSCKH